MIRHRRLLEADSQGRHERWGPLGQGQQRAGRGLAPPALDGGSRPSFVPLRRLLAGVIATVVLVLLFAGCGGGGQVSTGGGQDTGTRISDAQAQTLDQQDDAVTAAVQGSLEGGGSYEDAAAAVQGLEGVQAAVATRDTLVVTYSDGLIHVFKHDPVPQRPSYIPQLREVLDRVGKTRTVGNRRALIINCLSSDPGFAADIEPLDVVAANLDSAGYAVDRADGSVPSLGYLQQRLSDYAFVLYLGHGGASASDFAAQTGQQYGGWTDYVRFWGDWSTGRICKITIEWGSEDEREHTWRHYWAIRSGFVRHYYADRSRTLPYSIFYNCACQGLKNDSFADALVDSGCAAYIGWTETQAKSPWSADQLFALMTDGRGTSLADALARLPEDVRTSRVSENGETIDAAMTFFPTAGGTVQLDGVQTPLSVAFTAPENGSTTDSRVVTVSGTVANAPSDARGTVTVNGRASTALEIPDGTFIQKVAVRPGANLIQVLVYSSAGGASGEVTVNSTAPASDLWTELRWDTDRSDIDLHLLPPSATLSDLWTPVDCYFANKTTTWGAALDVDDIEGYGPEHITLQQAAPGRYTLVVHYWDNDGVTGITWPEVFVIPGSSALQSFGPVPFAVSGTQAGNAHAGDVWSVCYIDFPSGSITPIDRVENRFLGSRILMRK